MKKSPNPYFNHIIDAAAQINEYAENLDKVELKHHRMAYDAIVRQLEIIWEACSRLEGSFKQSHPKIPWKQIIGMRNKLAYEYWDVDVDIVWQAATVETPQLKKQLLDLLNTVGQ